MSDNLASVQAALANLTASLDYIRGISAGSQGNISGAAIVAGAAAGQSNKHTKAAVTKLNLAANELTNIVANLISSKGELQSYINRTRG